MISHSLHAHFNHSVMAAMLMLVVPVLLLAGSERVRAAGKAQVTWYGQSAFKIVTPSGGVILIDPWLSNPKNPDKDALAKLERVDYILVTHGHGDHIGQSVEIARKTGAKLVATPGLGRNMVAILGYPKDQAGSDTLGNVGGMIELPQAKARVTFVNAVHGSEMALPKPVEGGPMVVEGGNPVGFVLEMEGGPTVYHTGDTDVTTDMKFTGEMFPVDVMLACIGDHYTMNPARAAVAVGLVNPKVVVPMHFGTFPALSGTPDELQAELGKRKLATQMVVMQPGETRAF